jgi:hypothetical protein
MMIEAEIGMMHLQAKNEQLPEARREKKFLLS